MKLIDWLTRQDSTDFFDYSTILLRVEVIERELSDACLNRQFDKVPALADELVEKALLLKKWVKAQK